MSLPTQDAEAAYYQGVEEYFVSRRGDPLFLSNADWNLVRKWRTAGLPLRVVLRGIRDTFDAHAHGWSRTRKVGSLAYCAGEVDAARERWERALALGSEPGIDTRSVIDGLAVALEQATGLGPGAGALARATACELRGLTSAGTLAALSAWLVEQEKALVRAIGIEESDTQRSARESAVDEALAPWRRRMPAPVLQQLRAESLIRRTLEEHGLPRLSLFHIEGGGAGDP